MADEDTRKLAEDAANTGAELAHQFAVVLREHAAPIHVAVIGELMGMMLACLPPEDQERYFISVLTLAARYTADYEKQVAAHKAEKRH